jgi:hypothetical protein
MEENNCSTTQRPRTIREFFRSAYFWKPFLSIFIGGILGFAYFYFIGCKAGSCAITSNPLSSIVMGSLLGFLVTNSPCNTCKGNGVQGDK